MRVGGIPEDAIGQQERKLFLSAGETPGWTVGHKAQVALANLLTELAEDDRLPKTGFMDISRDGDSAVQRKAAIRSLGIIAFRAVGSSRCLIACGYVPEAKAPIRRLTEAAIRAKAIADDRSGDHARAWLAGRPLGTPARLHRRYGTTVDSDGLCSRQAHAEVASLDDYFRLDATENVYLIAIPHRDEMDIELAGALMKAAGVQVLMLAFSLVATFDRLVSDETALELNEVCVMVGLRKTFNWVPKPPSDAKSGPA